ncbi:hypothetical protein MLGJGCBP_07135 [Rhodococcus sp. T7]|nr:hypothetical protein MLGJGCBP_07135 [Rhodococcus sp. T7]
MVDLTKASDRFPMHPAAGELRAFDRLGLSEYQRCRRVQRDHRRLRAIHSISKR